MKQKLNKIIPTLSATLTLILIAGNFTKANAQDIVCTVIYGQGEVCGVSTTEEDIHTPVASGLADVNFSIIVQIFIAVGISFTVISKLTRKLYLFEK